MNRVCVRGIAVGQGTRVDRAAAYRQAGGEGAAIFHARRPSKRCRRLLASRSFLRLQEGIGGDYYSRSLPSPPAGPSSPSLITNQAKPTNRSPCLPPSHHHINIAYGIQQLPNYHCLTAAAKRVLHYSLTLTLNIVLPITTPWTIPQQTCPPLTEHARGPCASTPHRP